MDDQPDPLYFLVRYVDYTIDMIALWPSEIQSLKDHKGVKNINRLPDGEDPLPLDRDYIVGVKKIKDLGEDDDD